MQKIYFRRGKIYIHSQYKKVIKKLEKLLIIISLIIGLVSTSTQCSMVSIITISIGLISFILIEFVIIFRERHDTIAMNANLERGQK